MFGGTVIGFLATPLLVRWLGSDRLGAIRTTEQILGYLLIFYVGLGPAFAVQILGALSQGGRARAEALVASSRRVHFLHSLVLFPFGLLLAVFVFPLVIRASSIPQRELIPCAAAAVSFSLLLYPLSVYRDLLECEQRSYWVHFALLLQALVVGAVGVGFARYGFRLPGQVAAILLGLTLYYGVLFTAADGWRPGAGLIAQPARQRIYVSWRDRWPLAITGVGNRVNLMSDAITVSILFGPAIVTDFVISQRLVLTGLGFLSGISNVAWAPLGELLHRGELHRVRERIGDLIVLVTGASLLAGTALAAYNRRFVALWVGPDHYGGDALSIATAAQGIVFGFFLIFAWTIDTQGHSRARVVVSTIGSAVNLGLSFLLGRQFGILGVCLATSVAYAVTDAWFCPWLFVRRFGLAPSDVLRPLSRSLVLAGPLVVAIWFVAHRAHGDHDSWSRLGLECACVGALMTVYFLFVMSTGRLRKELLTLIARRFRVGSR